MATASGEPMSTFQRRLQVALIATVVLGLGLNATTSRPSIGRTPIATVQPSRASFVPSSFNPSPRIALVYPVGGRGTSGFNELAWEGVQLAGAAFDAELTEVTAKPGDTDADRVAQLTELVDARNGPIFVIGSTYASAVATVAPTDPDVWFALLDDGSVDGRNVVGIQFNVEQGAFLVGAAAALTSKMGKVGFLGSIPTPQLQKYEAGFAAGARAVNPEIDVQVAYLAPLGRGGDVSIDAAKARTAALDMYRAGADVIFAAAGDAGSGVIQAAHELGRWAIGMDSDRYLQADPSVRDAILTSMLKRADKVAYTVTMEFANGVPKDGNNVFGLDRDGVGYSTSGGFVDPIRAQLDAFAARIASGEILVPTKP